MFRHGHKVTLILPENIYTEHFLDIINTALKESTKNIELSIWDADKKEEVEIKENMKDYELSLIHTSGDLTVEFRRKINE